jgi:hypothetical protein
MPEGLFGATFVKGFRGLSLEITKAIPTRMILNQLNLNLNLNRQRSLRCLSSPARRAFHPKG